MLGIETRQARAPKVGTLLDGLSAWIRQLGPAQYGVLALGKPATHVVD